MRHREETRDATAPYWLQGSAAAQTLAPPLLEGYPAAFHAEGAAVRPLKIGIDHDMRHALDVAPRVVSEVLRGAWAVPGALRVDLPGQPVAPVTPEQPQWAPQGSRRPARQAGGGHHAGERRADQRFNPVSAARREAHGRQRHLKVCAACGARQPRARGDGVPGVPERSRKASRPVCTSTNHPWSVAGTQQMWRTALQRTQAFAASGLSLWIVEAHVGVHEGARLAVVKGIQVVAGSPAITKPAASRGGPAGRGHTRARD